MEIRKDSTISAWKNTLRTILKEGDNFIDKDNRESKEMLNLIITINNPEQDIKEPISLMKNLKKWAYPSFDELEDVFFKKEASSVYYYTYGARIFNYSNTKNQVDDYVIPLLKKNPNTRRGIIILYHPLIDSAIELKESPSLLSIYFKITDDKLAVSTLIRSNDMFIGWPANVYQIFLLQKYVAEQLNISMGSMTTISHSAHIFKEYQQEVDEILRL